MKTEWKMVRLGEVVSPSNNSELVDPAQSYKMLGMSLECRGLFLREEKLGSQLSAKYLNRVVPNEFMYSRLFAWKGAFDLAKAEFEGCFVSDEYPSFTANPKRLDPQFLAYYFRQPHVWLEVERYCIGVTKASRNRFKEEFFLNFEIPLPPLAEQQRLVAKLRQVQAQLAQVQALRQHQDAEVGALLEAMFREAATQYMPQPLVAGLRHRKVFITIDDNDTYKLCRVQTRAKGVVLRSVMMGADIKTKKQQVCRAGDFLVAEMDARHGGYGLIPEDLNEAIVSSHYFLYEVDEARLNRQYLNYFAQTAQFADQVDAKGSTNYAAIRAADILGYTMPLPPRAEQDRVVALLDGLTALRTAHAATAEQLSQLLPSLLDGVFGGAVGT